MVRLTGGQRNAIFSLRDLSDKKTRLYLLCGQMFGDVDLTFNLDDLSV